MRGFIVLLQKEFLQIRRNPFLPKLIIAFPIMIMLIMPLIMTMDVRMSMWLSLTSTAQQHHAVLCRISKHRNTYRWSVQHPNIALLWRAWNRAI